MVCVVYEHMFDNAKPVEMVFEIRCASCRSESWFAANERDQGKAAFLGNLYVYADNPTEGLGELSGVVGTWRYGHDGFYASFDEFFRADGYQHQRSIREASRTLADEPSRMKSLKVRSAPSSQIPPGRPPFGALLKARCSRGHVIRVTRDRLKSMIASAGTGRTLHL
jgi:hypothetical protein